MMVAFTTVLAAAMALILVPAISPARLISGQGHAGHKLRRKHLPPPPKLRPHPGPLLAEVTFAATGTYRADFVYSGSFDNHATVALNLNSRFQTDVRADPDNRLAMTMTAADGDSAASRAVFDTTENYDGGLSTGHCSGDMPIPPNAPEPKLSPGRVGDGLQISAQSITAVSVNHADYSCPLLSGDDLQMNPDEYLGFPFEVSAPLPDALTAHFSIPDSALKPGTYKAPVTSAPITPTCDIKEPIPGCRQSLNWSGTVTVKLTDRCAKRGRTGPLPWCVDKPDAVKAARRYRKRFIEDRRQFMRIYGCRMPGAVFLPCLVAGIREDVDYNHMLNAQRAAADPPARTWAKVAHPHALRQTGLGRLKQPMPAFWRLARSQGRIIGLERAVITALNRSSGADQANNAKSGGSTDAEAALARQKRAIVKYGTRAARLLGTQNGLSRKAARELRRSARHRRGRGRAARIERSMADSIVSRKARRASRAQRNWLTGFGR